MKELVYYDSLMNIQVYSCWLLFCLLSLYELNGSCNEERHNLYASLILLGWWNQEGWDGRGM